LALAAVAAAPAPAHVASGTVRLSVDAGAPSGEELHGGWGLVTLAGTRKPAWWTFWLWRRLAPLVLATRLGSLPSDGIWAVASRGPSRRRLTVLVSSFLAEGAHPHTLEVKLSGLAAGRWRVGVRRIDAGHPSAGAAQRRVREVGPGGRLDMRLALPAQAVVFLGLRRIERSP
jgi:hypothetical protein